jgi:hypothetical protein
MLDRAASHEDNPPVHCDRYGSGCQVVFRRSRAALFAARGAAVDTLTGVAVTTDHEVNLLGLDTKDSTNAGRFQHRSLATISSDLSPCVVAHGNDTLFISKWTPS